MATSTYFKPDVEVLQEFRNINPVVLKATLQSVIVGPSYQKIKDPNSIDSTEAAIGSYDGTNPQALPFPTLSPGAIVMEDSLTVTIKNYAGEHIIPKTKIKIDGNNGSISASTLRFVDNNQNFIAANVVASTGVSDHDGDFLHILSGPKAGYYEIQEVVDAHTLIVDDPDGVLADEDASNLHYTIGNFGWMIVDISATQKGILLTPRLSDSGIVYLSGIARRVDYTERLVVAESIYDLEQVFGEPVSLSNPLAYGMAKTLASLGANEMVLGLMVEDDTPTSYQKAFEFLESEDVYCIVPLSTNPIVHQLLKEHVNAMSAVEQKAERIGLFNTARYNRIIRSGYFGRQNAVTKAWDIADGNIIASGTALGDVVTFNHESFSADGSGVEQVETIDAADRFNRLIVYFRPKTDATFSYALSDAPSVDVPFSMDDDGKFVFQAPAGKYLVNVKFTSTALRNEKCEIFYAKTDYQPANSEIKYAALMGTGIQMDNPYLTPTAGHKSIKIRHFDYTNPTANPLLGKLPEGMTIRVSFGNGLVRDITYAGQHNFPGDITQVYVFNKEGAENIDNHLIEVMFLETGGTYSVNAFEDAEATFLSDKIVAGVDELVLIDTSTVDQTTFSKFAETRFKIYNIVNENKLLINQIWNTELSRWEQGEFPGIMSGVRYRVETPIITDKYQMATWIRDISKGFGDRRMTHIYAPAVGVTDDGVTITPVPGYYFACAYAGATQSELPQMGFTNRPFAGFARVFFTNDYFTESHLNVIAEGGTTIVIQPRALAPLTVRHQLTTDMTSIEKREYSVTKNLDHMAKTARITFRPYIGRYLINDDTLNILYSVGNALVERWKRDGQVITGSVDKFQVDPTQADKVFACFYLKVPIPLNYIRLIFVI